MDNYILKIASLDEIIKKADYEISRNPNNNMWVVFKKRAIKNYQENNTITYIGVLDGVIICELSVVIKEEGFKDDINNYEYLLTDDMVYLFGFRTNKDFEGKGYFSKLFKYMEDDIKSRGYRRMCLGVTPSEVRNMQIYFHWGFINYIRTTLEYLPAIAKESKPIEEIVSFYYKDI